MAHFEGQDLQVTSTHSPPHFEYSCVAHLTAKCSATSGSCSSCEGTMAGTFRCCFSFSATGSAPTRPFSRKRPYQTLCWWSRRTSVPQGNFVLRGRCAPEGYPRGRRSSRWRVAPRSLPRPEPLEPIRGLRLS